MKLIYIDENFGITHKEEPVVFLKPKTSLILNRFPFFYPDFSYDIRAHAEVVLKIMKLGKNISIKFAKHYYDSAGISIRFYAHDLLEECKKNSLPWEKAVAFNGSTAISEFLPVDAFLQEGGTFNLSLNQQDVQAFSIDTMVYNFDEIISHISKYFTLTTGDLIFTGISEKSVSVKINDILETTMNGKLLLKCKIK
jgi:2-keto-4-pentenoate hydratase/2-oxohepta-3-ene-1,7-dioic acid hydratase in catechol pathway